MYSIATYVKLTVPLQIVIIGYSVSLLKRPGYQSFSGAVFSLAYVLGFSVGGALITHVT